MPPKKKNPATKLPSTSVLPVPSRTGGGVDVEGGGLEPPRRSGGPSLASGAARSCGGNPHTAGSRDGAVLPTGGVANSTARRTPPGTPAPAQTLRPSQVARDEQRPGTGDLERPHGKTPAHRSQGAQAQHARQAAGGGGARSRDRDGAPSNTLRSQSTSRTSHLSPPPMPAEALARAQLLLDFPPASERMEEWQFTIQSLIGFVNKDG
jgi:hypothetical protein